jgi:hypothetical protein
LKFECRSSQARFSKKGLTLIFCEYAIASVRPMKTIGGDGVIEIKPSFNEKQKSNQLPVIGSSLESLMRK